LGLDDVFIVLGWAITVGLTFTVIYSTLSMFVGAKIDEDSVCKLGLRSSLLRYPVNTLGDWSKGTLAVFCRLRLTAVVDLYHRDSGSMGRAAN
jgi:hypothetical protein